MPEHCRSWLSSRAKQSRRLSDAANATGEPRLRWLLNQQESAVRRSVFWPRKDHASSESPNLQRVASGAFLDADENGVHAGARETEGPVGVEHGEGIFVGVVPHHVLVGIEH